MSYQVLARKYRPATFEQMVGQEHVLKALVNALNSNRLHHAYLFTGTRGVGKTSLARLFAKSLNCEQGVSASPCGHCSNCSEIAQGRFVDLIEVDAASRTKVEDTRELLENVQYAPSKGRFKVYLIDEVHMLSSHSFNALLKTLEEPPPHIKFLLATTDPQKLPVTILSRCLQFNLKNMTPERVVEHLQTVLQAENVPFDEPALWLLGRAADGSMRDALSLTDQAIAYSSGALVEADVRSMLGSVDQHQVMQVLECLADQDAAGVMARVAQMAEYGFDSDAILAELLNLLHRVAMAQMLPGSVDNSLGDRDQMLAVAARLRGEDVQLFYQIGLSGRRDLPLVPVARDGLEMTLLRMLAFRPVQAGEVALPQGGRSAPAASDTGADRSTASVAATAAFPKAEFPNEPGVIEKHVNEQNGAASNVAQQAVTHPAAALERPAAHPEPTPAAVGRDTASLPASNQEPSASNPEPSASNPEPSASNPKPSASKQEPSASNPEPSASKQEPSASNPKPSASIPGQSTLPAAHVTPPPRPSQEPPPWNDAPPWGDGAPHQPLRSERNDSNNGISVKKPLVRTQGVDATAQGQAPLNTASAPGSLAGQHDVESVAVPRAPVFQSPAVAREPVPVSEPMPAAERQTALSPTALTTASITASTTASTTASITASTTAPASTATSTIAAPPSSTGSQAATLSQVSDTPIIDRLADLDGLTWIGLLDQLGLTGMTYNIAANASIKSVTAEVVTLLVLRQQMSLFNDTHRNRIEAALNDYFSSTLRVDVEAGEPVQETPAQHQERCRLERLALAVSAMENDSTVQQLIRRYDARLDIGSITPID